MKKKLLIVFAVLFVVVAGFYVKRYIQESLPIPKESYNKTLKVLYLGNKDSMYDTWVKDGISVRLVQDLTDYNNNDMVVVSKDFYYKFDIETAKRAIKEGKQFFFVDVTDSTYIDNKILNETAGTTLLEETSIVQYYYVKDKIQSASVILKTIDNYINDYTLISKYYEEKKKLMVS